MKKYAVAVITLLFVFAVMPISTPVLAQEAQPTAQEAAEGMADEAQEAAEGMADEAQETAEGMADEAQETAEGMADEAQEATEGMADEAQEATEGMATDEDASQWYWILGLAAAFIIVWLALRKRRAAREA